MSVLIGLTGPTGAGKSTVSGAAEKFGFKVIDCDKTARKATEKGSEGLNALVKAFGDEILLPDGSLNRKALAAKAFKRAEATELLNDTLLPYIVRLIYSEAGDGNCLLDAPTLFESGIDTACFKTIAVLADRETRKKRIIERDGLSEKEALLRMNAGKNDDFYKSRADCIIYNNGDENAVIKRFSDILKKITEELQ